MKNKKLLIESGKTALIVLLLASAVLLLFKAALFEPSEVFERLASFLGAEPSGGSDEPGSVELSAAAASPRYVLVTTQDGSHYAAKYDGANKERLISLFSSYLGMALGSADAPVIISEAEWRSALSSSGVFFDYIYPQPVSAMALWLGTSLSGSAGEHLTRRLYLGSRGGAVCLYYIDESDHTIYRCSTAFSFSDIAARIADIPSGGSFFAFELEEGFDGLDPYFIFSEETAQLRAVTAANPLSLGYSSADLLSLFKMNSRTTLESIESDGSAVYVDGEKSLQIDSFGSLTFSAADGEGIAVARSSDELQIFDCIALVYSIAKQSAGELCGEAELGLSGISNASSPSDCTLHFSYFIGGIPVSLPSGASAVRAQISSGAIVRIDMLFRSYTYSGESMLPLPEKQACAAAQAMGGEPLLKYEDKTDGVSWAWVVN